MQETNGKVLTPQEYEEIVTDVTLGMDDCYSVEEVDHGAYEDVLSEPTQASEPTDINKQMYTEQENENMVAEVSSGMNDPLEPENTPGTPENLVKQMEAVAQEL